jgi:hypothetical protein
MLLGLEVVFHSSSLRWGCILYPGYVKVRLFRGEGPDIKLYIGSALFKKLLLPTIKPVCKG